MSFIGKLFGGDQQPMTPPPLPAMPPPPPAVQQPIGANAQTAATDRAQKAAGAASTIITGPEGLKPGAEMRTDKKLFGE